MGIQDFDNKSGGHQAHRTGVSKPWLATQANWGRRIVVNRRRRSFLLASASFYMLAVGSASTGGNLFFTVARAARPGFYLVVEAFLVSRHLPRSTWCRFFEGTGRPAARDIAPLLKDLAALDPSALEERIAAYVRADFDAGRITHIDGWIMTGTEAMLATALSEQPGKSCPGKTAALLVNSGA